MLVHEELNPSHSHEQISGAKIPFTRHVRRPDAVNCEWSGPRRAAGDNVLMTEVGMKLIRPKVRSGIADGHTFDPRGGILSGPSELEDVLITDVGTEDNP